MLITLWLGARKLRIQSAGFFDALGATVVLGIGWGGALFGAGFLPANVSPWVLLGFVAFGTLAFLKSVYETTLGKGLVLTLLLAGGLGLGAIGFLAAHLGPAETAQALQTSEGRQALPGRLVALAEGSAPASGTSTDAVDGHSSPVPTSAPTPVPAPASAAPVPPSVPPSVSPSAPRPSPAPSPSPSPTPEAPLLDLDDVDLDPSTPDPTPAPTTPATPATPEPPPVPPPPPPPSPAAPPPPSPSPAAPPPPRAPDWSPESVGQRAPRITGVNGLDEPFQTSDLLGQRHMWIVFLDGAAPKAKVQDKLISELEGLFQDHVAFVSVVDQGDPGPDRGAEASRDWALATGRDLTRVVALDPGAFPSGRPGDADKPRHVLVDLTGKVRFVHDGYARPETLKKKLVAYLERGG